MVKDIANVSLIALRTYIWSNFYFHQKQFDLFYN